MHLHSDEYAEEGEPMDDVQVKCNDDDGNKKQRQHRHYRYI